MNPHFYIRIDHSFSMRSSRRFTRRIEVNERCVRRINHSQTVGYCRRSSIATLIEEEAQKGRLIPYLPVM